MDGLTISTTGDLPFLLGPRGREYWFSNGVVFRTGLFVFFLLFLTGTPECRNSSFVWPGRCGECRRVGSCFVNNLYAHFLQGEPKRKWTK